MVSILSTIKMIDAEDEFLRKMPMLVSPTGERYGRHGWCFNILMQNIAENVSSGVMDFEDMLRLLDMAKADGVVQVEFLHLYMAPGMLEPIALPAYSVDFEHMWAVNVAKLHYTEIYNMRTKALGGLN